MNLSNIFLEFVLVSVTLCGIVTSGLSVAIASSPMADYDFNATLRYADWGCTSNATCTTSQAFCNGEKKCQCPPGYVFNAAMTACLEIVTAYGDKCVETAQCVAYLLVGGECTNGICNCATGYHYLHGQCSKSSGLGEKCQNDDDCFVNADFEALSCTDGTCGCSDGFYQREYRTCRREAKVIGAECSIDMDCTFNETARCDKSTGCYIKSRMAPRDIEEDMANDLGRTIRKTRAFVSNLNPELRCEVDEECSHLGQSVCTALGYCICERGYGFVAGLNNCIAEIGENCQLDDNVRISDSICRDGRWGCVASKVPARNNLSCLKATTKFNSSCKSDEQCYVFGPDSICVQGHCVCNENSHYVEKEMFCWINTGLNESCVRDEDCYVPKFGSKLICSVDFKCACPNGTYVNWVGTECIENTPTLGSSCSADQDCSPLDNVQCLDDSCSCIDDYYDLSGECTPGINASCNSDHDCRTNNSTCQSRICRCSEGLVSPISSRCISVSAFGDECQYDIQCSAAAVDSICSKPEVVESEESRNIGSTPSIGTCDCNIGHHRKYGKCYRTKVLGETCYSQGECYVTSDPDSVHCLKGVCTCEFDATRINSTFCENGAPEKYVLSMWLVLTTLFLVSFD